MPADSPIWMHGAVTRQEACASGVLLIARPMTRAFWMPCGKLRLVGYAVVAVPSRAPVRLRIRAVELDRPG